MERLIALILRIKSKMPTNLEEGLKLIASS